MSMLPDTFGYRYLPSMNNTPMNDQYVIEDAYDHIYTCRKSTKKISDFWDTRKVPEVEMTTIKRDESVFVSSVCMYPVTFVGLKEFYENGSAMWIADVTSSFLRYRKPQKNYTLKQAVQYFKRFGLELK